MYKKSDIRKNGIRAGGQTHLQLGFTLIELLVVVGIIALLVSVLLPSLREAKAMARLAVCNSTLHQLGLGNAMYASDWEEFSVHGMEGKKKHHEDRGGRYGWYFTSTAVFDDDCPRSSLSNPDPKWNTYSNGGQNICSVGQLMWGAYIEETASAIGCQQADFEEITESSGGSPQENPASYQDIVEAMSLPRVDPQNPGGLDPNSYWRNEYYDPGAAAGQVKQTPWISNYVVRGPLFRPGDITTSSTEKSKASSEVGIFCDWEQASSGGLGPSSIPSSGGFVLVWPRRHRQGINVAYLDGHVTMFNDERRTKISNSKNWASDSWVGNGRGLYQGLYDQSQ